MESSTLTHVTILHFVLWFEQALRGYVEDCVASLSRCDFILNMKIEVRIILASHSRNISVRGTLIYEVNILNFIK